MLGKSCRVQTELLITDGHLFLVLRCSLAIQNAGKLPVSFPRSVGTTPVFYNYLKGGRFVDPGQVLDDGTLKFGHQVRENETIPCQPNWLIFFSFRAVRAR